MVLSEMLENVVDMMTASRVLGKSPRAIPNSKKDHYAFVKFDFSGIDLIECQV